MMISTVQVNPAKDRGNILDRPDDFFRILSSKHNRKGINPVFGGINLEDIAAPRCFEIERRLQEELSIPVLHDDQHGTALVVSPG